MTVDEQQAREIEDGERWLREVCQDSPPPDLDRIKLRVRIAANEEWLGRTLDDEVPAGLADRAKRRIWATLANDRVDGGVSRSPSPSQRARRNSVYRWVGAIGAMAAACAFAFVSLYRGADGEPELAYVSAFEAFVEDDEFAESLALVRDDLDGLELAYFELMTGEDDESALDDLRYDLDSLLGEDDPEDGWS